MKPTRTRSVPLSITASAILGLCAAAHAQTELKPQVLTNARPASAASAPGVRRTLSFGTHHQVPATLSMRGGAVAADGWTAQVRFAGQADTHECNFHLPKNGEVVQPGQPATGTLQCETPWQVYDNGLSFQAFVGGQLKGEGTIRP